MDNMEDRGLALFFVLFVIAGAFIYFMLMRECLDGNLGACLIMRR